MAGDDTQLHIAYSFKVQIHCYETTDLDGLSRVGSSGLSTRCENLAFLDLERVQIPYHGFPSCARDISRPKCTEEHLW